MFVARSSHVRRTCDASTTNVRCTCDARATRVRRTSDVLAMNVRFTYDTCATKTILKNWKFFEFSFFIFNFFKFCSSHVSRKCDARATNVCRTCVARASHVQRTFVARASHVLPTCVARATHISWANASRDLQCISDSKENKQIWVLERYRLRLAIKDRNISIPVLAFDLGVVF